MTGENNGPVLLFDGYCNLCSGAVKFVLRNEKNEEIRFAPLDSEKGKQLMENMGIEASGKETMIFIEDDHHYEKSRAAAELFKRLGSPYPLMGKIISLLPNFLTDFGYFLVSKSRYKLFGTKDTCMVPADNYEDRFLD